MPDQATETAAVSTNEKAGPEKAPEKKKPELKGWRRFWVEYARPFLIVALVITAGRSSLLDWNDVPTGSMKPTIIEGDRILVNKLAYDLKIPFWTWNNAAFHIFKWGDPKPGDIVVFFSPYDGTRLVKRVVAGPGDVVQVKDEVLTVNGVAATYGPLSAEIADQVDPAERSMLDFAREKLGTLNHPIMFYKGAMHPSFGPFKVPPGHYFMMGDNRDNSKDSRYSVAQGGPGAVPRDNIVGRASRVAVSVDPQHSYMPRWSRFFKALP